MFPWCLGEVMGSLSFGFYKIRILFSESTSCCLLWRGVCTSLYKPHNLQWPPNVNDSPTLCCCFIGDCDPSVLSLHVFPCLCFLFVLSPVVYLFGTGCHGKVWSDSKHFFFIYFFYFNTSNSLNLSYLNLFCAVGYEMLYLYLQLFLPVL